ncbi:MAG: glycosyltransferase family 2 protein [Chitinophagaceae bacterium]|nr:glycosyltransferase family 2 protein [Chitinophagaceae bacterium]
MKEPFFSVIIPTYNRAGLISKTIDSVLQQSFQDFEIVIVDNKSTDNTAEVLQPYLQDERIRFHVQEQNYERSRSRNKGMELAQGRYLTFLDSDDLLYKNSLELASQYVQSHDSVNIFHHYYENRDTEDRLVYSYSFPGNYRHIIKKLLLANFLSCIGVFISRTVYGQYRFDEAKAALGSEDWDFWIRVVADHPLGVIPQVAAAIIQHDERTVQQNKAPAILARKDYYLNKYRTTPELLNKLGKQLHIFESGFYLYTATVSYQSGHYRKGYKYIGHAFIKYPACSFTKVFWKIFLSPVKKIFIK